MEGDAWFGGANRDDGGGKRLTATWPMPSLNIAESSATILVASGIEAGVIFLLLWTVTRMFFWLRELAGWGLIGGSLVVLKMGLDLALDLQRTQIVQASIIVFGAMGLLRAGVLLIRMSTAARICRADQEPERGRA